MDTLIPNIIGAVSFLILAVLAFYFLKQSGNPFRILKQSLKTIGLSAFFILGAGLLFYSPFDLFSGRFKEGLVKTALGLILLIFGSKLKHSVQQEPQTLEKIDYAPVALYGILPFFLGIIFILALILLLFRG